MAIPADPTVSSIILQGMQEAGRFSVTSTSHADYAFFLANYWATVKTEIWNACRTDKMLESVTARTVLEGTYYVDLPDDFDNEINVTLYDGGSSDRGTAQAGGASTITLASDFDADDDALKGLLIFILTGTGAGRYRMITSYNNSTKVLTADTAWGVTPDITSTYLIAKYARQLDRVDYNIPARSATRPCFYSRRGTNMEFYPGADQDYPVIIQYRPNLTQLDETSNTVFIKHLRERRHLWVQGVKVKTMARWDEERYPMEKQIWDTMLRQYAGQNVVYSQMKVSR